MNKKEWKTVPNIVADFVCARSQEQQTHFARTKLNPIWLPENYRIWALPAHWAGDQPAHIQCLISSKKIDLVGLSVDPQCL